MMSKCFWMVALSLLSAVATAAGFDDKYKVYIGNYNGDGLSDLYVKATGGTIVILLDDIPIVIPPAVDDFVLQNQGNGTFSLVNLIPASRRASLAQWPEANVGISFRDVDANGADDLTIEAVEEVIPDAFDLIVFATTNRGAAPLQLAPKDEKFLKYHRDLTQWFLDPDYFDNVPLKLVSSQPSAADWFGFISDSTNFGALFRMIQRCQDQSPGKVCGYTSLDPQPNSADPGGCIRPVVLYDSNDQPAGVDPSHDVCQYDTHVYVYTSGSVTVAADTSIYDTDARETADIIEKLRTNCSTVPVLFQ